MNKYRLIILLAERNFLTFETVTVVPIQTKMIGKSRSEIYLAFFLFFTII